MIPVIAHVFGSRNCGECHKIALGSTSFGSVSMEVTFAALTDVGKKRDHNEDAFLVDSDVDLFAVCDGMGGHAAGEVASAIAVETIREAIEQNADLIESYRSGDAEIERYEVLQMLEHAIQTACSSIYETAQADSGKRGMGTTCSMLMIIGGRGFIGHVGDSRVYLIRDEMIHQLTEDHSLVNELVRRGKLKRDQVEGSPYNEYKNAVTRAVGVYPSVEGDTLDFDVLPGDKFLLCSDGQHFYLDEDESLITQTFAQDDLEAVTEAFIKLANDGGGHDNITSVVVRVAADAPEHRQEKAAEINLTIEVLQQIPLFKYCTYKEFVRIVNITEVRDYAPGDSVFEEGSEGDYLFVVLKGHIELHKGKAFITSFESGRHFGEMALVDRTTRSAHASAKKQSRLLLIHRRDFYAIIRKETSLSVKLLWSFVQVLADRLRDTTQNLSVARLEADAEDLTDDVSFE
jgi:serine/threonine protein phosphatase PrpC